MHEITFITAPMPKPPAEPDWLDATPDLADALVRAFDFTELSDDTRGFHLVHLTSRYVVGANPTAIYLFEHGVAGITDTWFAKSDLPLIKAGKTTLAGIAVDHPTRMLGTRDGSWCARAAVGSTPTFAAFTESNIAVARSHFSEPTCDVNWDWAYLRSVLTQYGRGDAIVELGEHGIRIGDDFCTTDFGTFDAALKLSKTNFCRLVAHASTIAIVEHQHVSFRGHGEGVIAGCAA